MSEVRLIDANDLNEQFWDKCMKHCMYCKYYKWDENTKTFCQLIGNAPTITPAMAITKNFDKFYMERIKNGEDVGANMRGEGDV